MRNTPANLSVDGAPAANDAAGAGDAWVIAEACERDGVEGLFRPDPLEPMPPSSGVPLMVADAEGMQAPAAPTDLASTGVPEQTLMDLAIKVAGSVPNFTSEWAAKRLCLPVQLVTALYERLEHHHFIETLGQTGMMAYRYACTEAGRRQAARLLSISGYVGPVPVGLPAYTAMLEWQLQQQPPIQFESVQEALSPLVLTDHAVQVAGLAAVSGRSLFLFGPPGNGKTSVGRLLHRVQQGTLWIPHSVGVDSHIIRLYDETAHQRIDDGWADSDDVDRRWVKVRRPFILAGGEMTMRELDLAYSPSLRFYEAPPHVKANGGTFMIDDFGRQQMDPGDLLNRWIVPMEQQVDHLTLHTGQKIPMPFRLLLLVATNLQVSQVADPAFLRRMGYRLQLEQPTVAQYREIFRRSARERGMEVADRLIDEVMARYRQEDRELRGSEPNELILRVVDICRLHREPLRLDADTLGLAWDGYFGLS